jgi:beta-N-acetylhexosaminidase
MSVVPYHAAPPDPLDPLVNSLFARMTVEQRVGQLMIVTFHGTSVESQSEIARLIRDYHVGGILLLAANDNIDEQPNTPVNVQSLINQLQQINYDASLPNGGRAAAYAPLFIATAQEGDSVPNMEIASGMTRLPSNMAIGATWQPDHARRVGSIAGQELSALGINMVFGPSLDVLSTPSNENLNTIGTRSFGGEPWWVGRMASAYVAGIHQGSTGRIAVVARDFPGLGSSDRRPDQEIPVVPRTAEELGRIDLVPFFAVTGQTTDGLAKADGLQCANIRYQGQNIRSITRPMCIDEQAFRDVMDMPGFGSWRADGGMIVSDALGTQAIRRWYNVTPFPHRQVAREALLAGNDMLLLNDFGPQVGDDSFNNITDVMSFFSTLYRSDPVFKGRVDQAVRRILHQKVKMYEGNLALSNIQLSQFALNNVGQNDSDLFSIARDALTLIAPSRQRLTAPPAPNNDIVIFTDVRMSWQCSFCVAHPVIPRDALQNALIRLYGPQGSAQVDPDRIHSYSFDELVALLNTPPIAPPSDLQTFHQSGPLDTTLDTADWIVFVMLDPNTPNANLIQTFLEARPDLVSKAKVVVLAFGAPTYLSATDISKLAAYYGLYSSAAPFVDTGARALFQEVSARGNLPISVPSVSYDVFHATSPDPGQIIRIVPESAGEQVSTTRTATPGVIPTTSVGDTLLLRTEPILDRNGHIVPDGTPVVFTLSFVTEGVQRQQDATTRDGIARTSFTLTRSGQIQITAASGDATTSVTFQVTVAENAVAATIQTIEPPTDTSTPLPTNTFTPSPTDTATSTATSTITLTPSMTSTATLTPSRTPTDTPTSSPSPLPSATPTSTPTPVPPPPRPAPRVGPRDFVAALLGLMLVSVFGFVLGWTTAHTLDSGLRVFLSCIIVGLCGYIWYATGLFGADSLRTNLQDFGAMLATLVAGGAGLVVGWGYILLRIRFHISSNFRS